MNRYWADLRRFLGGQGLRSSLWTITALICWSLFFFSLPGYYRWFYAEPLRLGFPEQVLFLSIVSGVASLTCALISLGLGSFLFLRKRGDRGALYVSYFLLLYGALMAGPIEMLEFWLTGQTLVISTRVQSVFFTLPLFLLFLTFPNGIITPARFRWLILFVIPIVPVMLILTPIETSSVSSLRAQLAFLYIGILIILAMGSQIYRYLRVSNAVERQQTKIVLYGIGIQTLFLLVSGIFYVQLPGEAYGSVNPEHATMSLLWWGGLAVLPVSITMAIFRARLWDIDFVIRRTLAYGFLSVALALVYFGSVILLQSIFRALIGHESSLAIILSTLGIASLFNPMRGSIQAAIDRRFYRGKYDTEQALMHFQHSLQERVNLEQVEGELTGIVQSTVQPEWVSLWMRKGSSH